MLPTTTPTGSSTPSLSTSQPLDQLPKELLNLSLKFLNRKELSSLNILSKKWKNEIVTDEKLWKDLLLRSFHYNQNSPPPLDSWQQSVKEVDRTSFLMKSFGDLKDTTGSIVAISEDEVAFTSNSAQSPYNSIKVWNVRTGELTKTFKAHQAHITSLIKLQERTVASAGHDGKIKIWNLETGKCIEMIEGEEKIAKISLHLLRCGQVAISSNHPIIEIWDLNKKALVQTLDGHEDVVSTIIQLSSGSLVSGSKDKAIKVWDRSSGECLQTLKGHKKHISSLVELPNGQLLSGSADKTMKIWEIKSGKCLKTLTKSVPYITSLAQLRSGQVVSTSILGAVQTWIIPKREGAKPTAKKKEAKELKV